MTKLISLAKQAIDQHAILPFSVYSSTKEQHIANVPVMKPLLIFILSGHKLLGKNKEICAAGTFVFLPNSPTIDMRNIPGDEEYFAIIIEFDYSDFDQFTIKHSHTKNYFQGDLNTVLEKALYQFIELSTFAPANALHFRKKELLQLIYLSGYEEVSGIAEPPSLSHRIYDIINANILDDWSADRLATHLSMSESTLRRRLKVEGSSIQGIKNKAKLGHGLHLIQTTMGSIGHIAERCGYQSQSRFTDQFKLLFGMTPSELRKTKTY